MMNIISTFTGRTTHRMSRTRIGISMTRSCTPIRMCPTCIIGIGISFQRSAVGHERRFANVRDTSALPLIADMTSREIEPSA
jgi:hypothetical protein